MSLESYQKIEDYFKNIRHFENASSILSWDEETMMPEKGAFSRNQSLAALSQLIHQQVASSKLKDLISDVDESTLDQWQRANYNWIKKRYTNATIIPDQLISKLTLYTKESQQAWRKLRSENDWDGFLPFFEKTLNTVKEVASIKADYYQLSCYDALLDDYSPGISSSQIDSIFSQLKGVLPSILNEILDKQKNINYIDFNKKFPTAKQEELSLDLMKLIGFDFNRGRVDTAAHPFCGGIKGDVRITTRYNENEFISSTMAICHETGHAIYELQTPSKYQFQPVGDALGMTLHESQSLLVEMHACRSRSFLSVLSKLLTKHFGSDKSFSEDNLYLHYTKVKPGLIRVDADEVTYPLHVILRYELEKALINDEITAKDLAPLWNEKMKMYLNLDTKGDYKNGVMQDVHWPVGLFGYFPAYALGSMLAAQFYRTALSHSPEIPSEIKKGNFKPLTDWLKENIHSKGSLLSFNELVILATSKEFSADDYLEHIKRRYLTESLVIA